jgi:hypothetical protein
VSISRRHQDRGRRSDQAQPTAADRTLQRKGRTRRSSQAARITPHLHTTLLHTQASRVTAEARGSPISPTTAGPPCSGRLTQQILPLKNRVGAGSPSVQALFGGVGSSGGRPVRRSGGRWCWIVRRIPA